MSLAARCRLHRSQAVSPTNSQAISAARTKWNRRSLCVGWAPPTEASPGGRCPPYETPRVRFARASAGLLRASVHSLCSGVPAREGSIATRREHAQGACSLRSVLRPSGLYASPARPARDDFWSRFVHGRPPEAMSKRGSPSSLPGEASGARRLCVKAASVPAQNENRPIFRSGCTFGDGALLKTRRDSAKRCRRLSETKQSGRGPGIGKMGRSAGKSSPFFGDRHRDSIFRISRVSRVPLSKCRGLF